MGVNTQYNTKYIDCNRHSTDVKPGRLIGCQVNCKDKMVITECNKCLILVWTNTRIYVQNDPTNIQIYLKGTKLAKHISEVNICKTIILN